MGKKTKKKKHCRVYLTKRWEVPSKNRDHWGTYIKIKKSRILKTFLCKARRYPKGDILEEDLSNEEVTCAKCLKIIVQRTIESL